MASTAGNGFIVAGSDLVANTRKASQIMNVSPARRGAAVRARDRRPCRHHRGDNRKMLIFPLGRNSPK